MNAVLILDKPPGMTSHDVVNRVRRILQQKAVGHLGTLDPSATGVLPLVLGSFTRLAQFYTSCEKSYEGVIRFGFATDTYDAEGTAATSPQVPSFSFEHLKNTGMGFIGKIAQNPPPFSAKKINGVPAYKLARKQKEVALAPVQVEIKQFEILKYEDERASFRARVASGTYMRSVAHDIGQALGCGAHLESLRRTASAEFDIQDAHTLEQVETAAREGRMNDLLVHPRKILPQFPSVTAIEEMAARIRTGRTVNLPEFSRSSRVKVFMGQGELIAIATRVAGTLFHAKLVLATEAAPQLVRS